MIINVSKNRKVSSQRDNKIFPFDTCNCTAMINALRCLNVEFPNGKYEQPEDNLANFILTNKEIDDLYKQTKPDYYRAYINNEPNHYKPFEWHFLLALGVNTWLGKNTVTFHEGIEISKIFDELDNGRPVVMSGRFDNKKPDGSIGFYNHIVTLVGYEKEDDFITNVIIDDSYGRTGMYSFNKTAEDGDDVYMSYENFIRQFKPLGNINYKWAHFFNV